MSNTSFQIGDVVQLKSGGPDITIVSINEDIYENGKLSIQCKWFENGKAFTESFPPAALEKSE